MALPLPLGDPALDAAVHYFGTHGLRYTAPDDVARSCDLDVRELRRRYPTSQSLAAGIFERMLDILCEQLEEQSKRGATLSERLQRWFELELQLLEPCKALVRSWLLDSLQPLSPSALLQGPLAFRYAAQIERELDLARGRGEVSGWVLPAIAAGAFVGLRRSLVLGWLDDDSPGAARTLPFARAEIAAFVRLLAPWPGLDEARLDEARPAHRVPVRVPEPRALPAPSAAVELPAEASPLPVVALSLPEESVAAAVPAVEQTEAAPALAVEAAIAQAPAVLGTFAETELKAEPVVNAVLGEVRDSEPAPLEASPPAPVKPGGEKPASRSKRRSRSKRSKN